MKKKIIILSVIASFIVICSFSMTINISLYDINHNDTIPYNKNLSSYGYVVNRLLIDSVFVVPNIDTVFGTDVPRVGSLVYRTVGGDSTLYVRYPTRWVKVGTSGGLQTLTKNISGDSIILSGGGEVLDNDQQQLRLSNDTLYLTNSIPAVLNFLLNSSFIDSLNKHRQLLTFNTTDDSLTISNGNSVYVPAAPVLSVNGKTGNVNLTTDSVPEGYNNLYFTTNRVRSSLFGSNGIGFNAATGTISTKISTASGNSILVNPDGLYVTVPSDSEIINKVNIADSNKVFTTPTYIRNQGFITQETDPLANSKTITLNSGSGISIQGNTMQTVGSNPSFTINSQNTSPLWNANQLQGYPLSNAIPVNGQVLQLNNGVWVPTTQSDTSSKFTMTFASNFGNTFQNNPITGTGTIYVNTDSTKVGTLYALNDTAKSISSRLNTKLDINDTTGNWAPRGSYIYPADTVNKWLAMNDTSGRWAPAGSYIHPSDTASMLSNYKTAISNNGEAINQRVKYTDTSSMLIPYVKKGSNISQFNNDVGYYKPTDTTSTLGTKYYINSQGFLKSYAETDPVWTAAKNGNTTITGAWTFSGTPTLSFINLPEDATWTQGLMVNSAGASPNGFVGSAAGGMIIAINAKPADYKENSNLWTNGLNTNSNYALVVNTGGLWQYSANNITPDTALFSTFWTTKQQIATQPWVQSQNYLTPNQDANINGNWNFLNAGDNGGISISAYMPVVFSGNTGTSLFGYNFTLSTSDTVHQIISTQYSSALALNSDGVPILYVASPGTADNILPSFFAQYPLATQSWTNSQGYLKPADLHDSLTQNALDVKFPLVLDAVNKNLSADTTMKDSSLVNYRQMKQYVGTNTGTGTVTSVGLTGSNGINVSGSPITSSGTISVTNDTANTIAGKNWVTNQFLAKGSAVTNVVGVAPINLTGTPTNVFVNIAKSGTSSDGYISSVDWNTFNNKKSNSDSTALTGYVSHNALNEALKNKVTNLGNSNLAQDSLNRYYNLAGGTLNIVDTTAGSYANKRLSVSNNQTSIQAGAVSTVSDIILYSTNNSPSINMGLSGQDDSGHIINESVVFDSTGLTMLTNKQANDTVLKITNTGSIVSPPLSNSDTTKFLTANSSGQLVLAKSYLNLQNVTDLDSTTSHQLIIQGQNIGANNSSKSIWFGQLTEQGSAGTENTFIGSGAGFLSQNFSYNTALGYQANAQPRGNYNIGVGTDIFGSSGGGSPLNGYNIYVGNNINTNASSDSNSIVIGHNENGKGSNTTLIGTPATTANYFYGAVSTTGALLGNSASITNNVAAGGIITAKNLSATGQLSIADTVVTTNFTASSNHSLYVCNSTSGITATLSTTDINWNGSPIIIIKNIGTGAVTLTNTWTSDPTTIAAGASEILAMVNISGTEYWIKIN